MNTAKRDSLTKELTAVRMRGYIRLDALRRPPINTPLLDEACFVLLQSDSSAPRSQRVGALLRVVIRGIEKPYSEWLARLFCVAADANANDPGAARKDLLKELRQSEDQFKETSSTLIALLADKIIAECGWEAVVDSVADVESENGETGAHQPVESSPPEPNPPKLHNPVSSPLVQEPRRSARFGPILLRPPSDK